MPRVVRRAAGIEEAGRPTLVARVFVTLLAVAWLLATASAQQISSYRILISNDDGVHAPALPVLAGALKAIGEVTIVAPADDQSGISQAVNTLQPIFRRDLTLAGGVRAIALTATPATAVQIAIKNIMMPRPDLVVTGINTAYNLGYSAYLSGTVGGGRQAVLEGVGAIATSMAASAAPRDFAAAAREVAALVKQVREHPLPSRTFLNVNIPPMPAGGYKGFRVTSQAEMRAGRETFAEAKRPGSNTPMYWSVYAEGASAPDGTDIWAVNNGYVSVTPMRVGEYDQDLARDVGAWLK